VSVDHVPLGRLGARDEVGKVALFLASDLASVVTGVTIPVDGGVTCRIGGTPAQGPMEERIARLAEPA
jgi:NAD(P)-dependent dehydrogenase (short-subunit alcohol dehydrogenase family)